MKDSLRVILVVLVATLIFPLSLFAEKDTANLTIPKNWVSEPSLEASGSNAYLTSSDPKEALMVLIRTISVPHQSALEWANDEAENLKLKGAKILVSPVEIAVNKKSWIKLETLVYHKSADGRTGTFRSEQYFAKQGSDLVVEVNVIGREMNFNALNSQGIEELLSSFNSDVKEVKEVATTRPKELEKLQLHFDGRKWEIGYEKRNEQQSIVEHVLEGETVYNWSELVTEQIFFGLQEKGTPEEFMESMKKHMNPSSQWNVLRKGANDIMYEWKVINDPNVDNQHEIARIISGKKAIYSIRYTTKKVPISPDRREEWIKLLDAVVLEKTLLLPSTQDEAQKHFNKGLILIYEAKTAEVNGLADINEAKLKESIEEFKNAIEFDPEHPIAYFNLGVSYKGLRKFEEAIPYIQKTIDLMPNWEEAYFELGKVYYLLKRYDDTITVLEKGLLLKPSVPAYLMLANVYLENKSDFNKAAEYYQKVIGLDVNNIEAYENLGYIYGDKKDDYDKAIEYYKKVISVDLSHANAYMGLGISYLKKKDKNSASEQVKKLRELNRNDLADQLQEFIDKLE